MIDKNIMDKFKESYDYLSNLEIVYYEKSNQFKKCLDIDVVKTNPDTLEIDNNEELNTKVQVWLEFGGIVKDEHLGLIPQHDIDLDCGADTFEEAIIELARLCKEKGLKEHIRKTISDEEINEFLNKYDME